MGARLICRTINTLNKLKPILTDFAQSFATQTGPRLCHPQDTNLLLLDGRWLPGCEGGVVLDQDGQGLFVLSFRK